MIQNSLNLKPHSDILMKKIEGLLNARGFTYDRPHAIADAIMKQSDFYAKNPQKSTPWHESWCQIAYIAYYLPLNWWRLAAATARGLEVGFFDGWDKFVDFGSGLGSASLAFESHGLKFNGGGLSIEISKPAVAIHKELHQGNLIELIWQQGEPKAAAIDSKTLAVFSYSFTELRTLPSWAEQCGGIFLVEPATKDDGRRLLKVRQDLISKGWHVVAPCTHQSVCPLLQESERDWCHDRAMWTPPAELLRLEQHMPIKNGTLPFSYLMLTKEKDQTQFSQPRARITGDLQEFKGFTKQLICRSSEREFLSWQKRDFKKQDYPKIARGDLITIKEDIEKKGNELRPKSIEDLVAT
jgi:hypothetical protein